jgi:hypothetical protein
MVDLAIGWLLAQPGVSCLLVCELQLLLLRLLLLLLLRLLLRLRLRLQLLLRLAAAVVYYATAIRRE